MNVKVNNPVKLAILVVALVCITVLMGVGTVSAEIGMVQFGSIVAYALGNGIAAQRGQVVEPIFSPQSPAPTGPAQPDPDPESTP